MLLSLAIRLIHNGWKYCRNEYICSGNNHISCLILSPPGVEGKDSEILDVVYRFSLRTRKWTQEPRMLQPMLLPILANTHSGIYALFNTHPDNRAVQKTRDVSLQHYDPDTTEWSYKAPMLSQVTLTLTQP